MTTTPIDTARLRELLAGATALPFRYHRETHYAMLGDGRGYRFAAFDDEQNADLIVAAVNALPELLDEVERLRAHLCTCDEGEDVPGTASGRHRPECVVVIDQTLHVVESDRDAFRDLLERARGGLGWAHYTTETGSHCIGSEQRWRDHDCPLCSTDPAALAARAKP